MTTPATPAMPAQEASVSPSDPMVLLAGIKHFGLASDGCDIRDLETAIARLQANAADAERRATEAEAGWKIAAADCKDLQSRLSAVEARCGLMRAFVEWAIMDVAFKGGGIDGADIQDKAAELGLLVSEKYDPAIHGENDVGAVPGDQWFVPSPILAYPGGKSEVPTDYNKTAATGSNDSQHITSSVGEKEKARRREAMERIHREQLERPRLTPDNRMDGLYRSNPPAGGEGKPEPVAFRVQLPDDGTNIRWEHCINSAVADARAHFLGTHYEPLFTAPLSRSGDSALVEAVRLLAVVAEYSHRLPNDLENEIDKFIQQHGERK